MAKMPLGYSSDKLLGMLDEAKRKSRQPGVYNIDRDQVMSFGLSPQRVGMEIVKQHPEMGVQVLGEDLKVVDLGINPEEHSKILQHPQNNISPGVSWYPRGEGKLGGIRPDRYSGLYRGMTESVHPKHYGFGHTESQISSADEVNDDASAGSFVTTTAQRPSGEKPEDIKNATLDGQRRFTEAEYDMLNRILEYERKNGTRKTALQCGQTFGYLPGIPDPDPEGPSLGDLLGQNAAVPTVAGSIDLDWWTDIITFDPGIHSVPYIPDANYTLGKLFRKGVGIFEKDTKGTPLWPYQDPNEKRALDAIRSGKRHYRDLFTPEFMEEHKPLQTNTKVQKMKRKAEKSM